MCYVNTWIWCAANSPARRYSKLRSVSSNAKPQAAPPIPGVLAGIGLLVIAVACFAVLDTTTKKVTAAVPLLMAVWFRYLFQAIFTTALALQQHGQAVFKTQKPVMQSLRGLLMLLVTLMSFASLQFMPVGEFTAIVMSTPMLVTLLAAKLLDEHVSVFRIGLVLGGFAGTLLIIQPGAQQLGWPTLLPLGMVLANTAFQLLTSHLARTENVLTIQVYTSWIGTLLAALPLYWFWNTINDLQLWLSLMLMGAAGSVGHMLLVMAFKKAPAATLMPYMYLQSGFAMLGGWLIFHHIPETTALMGAALIALCGCAGAVLTLIENRMRSA